MKKENSPKKNFIYNVIYQVLILIIPLITAPYLARVIGAKGVGIYSYTYSIVYYFMLLTLLGVNNYGNRSIAKVRDNKDQLSSTFWSIYYFQMIMGAIMLCVYYTYVLLIAKEYKVVAAIQGIYIFSAMFDINWFFFGIEEFKKTITRNSIFKILSAILVFIIVKETNDVWKYTLIMAGMTFFSQLILWDFLKKYINYSKVSFSDIKAHIKPNIVLFIPVIAISLYKIMDKIMLGYISGVTEVGFYENAEKIINIPLSLITALGTVMLPRMSNIIASGNKEQAGKYLKKSIEFVSFLSLAMCAGLITIGKDFAPLFFGNGFKKTGILIALLSITIPFFSLANVLRTQYLIPKEKDKVYIVSVFIGAFTNLVMNIIFIPKYYSVGACFGTIAAEFSVMLYQLISITKESTIIKYIIPSTQFLIKAIIMFLVINCIGKYISNSLTRIIMQIILGATVYLILNIKYILSIIDFKKIINNIRNNMIND